MCAYFEVQRPSFLLPDWISYLQRGSRCVRLAMHEVNGGGCTGHGAVGNLPHLDFLKQGHASPQKLRCGHQRRMIFLVLLVEIADVLTFMGETGLFGFFANLLTGDVSISKSCFLIRTSTANSDIPFCLPSLNYVLPPRLVDMCADDAICLCQLWHSCCKISLVLVRGQGLASWKFRTKDCPCAS